MQISEDRISHLSHKILEKLWRYDLADFPDEARTLSVIKSAITTYFSFAEEVDQSVRKKLASYAQAKVPGSRDWEILYQKFHKEEMAKRKW
jgi:hypothetical protein